MTLEWTRARDGDHNGRPVYEYHAAADTVRFHICWAYDAGFGLSAFDHKAQRYLGARRGISWLRSLRNCKAEAEKLLAEYRSAAR